MGAFHARKRELQTGSAACREDIGGTRTCAQPPNRRLPPRQTGGILRGQRRAIDRSAVRAPPLEPVRRHLTSLSRENGVIWSCAPASEVLGRVGGVLPRGPDHEPQRFRTYAPPLRTADTVVSAHILKAATSSGAKTQAEGRTFLVATTMASYDVVEGSSRSAALQWLRNMLLEAEIDDVLRDWSMSVRRRAFAQLDPSARWHISRAAALRWLKDARRLIENSAESADILERAADTIMRRVRRSMAPTTRHSFQRRRGCVPIRERIFRFDMRTGASPPMDGSYAMPFHLPHGGKIESDFRSRAGVHDGLRDLSGSAGQSRDGRLRMYAAHPSLPHLERRRSLRTDRSLQGSAPRDPRRSRAPSRMVHRVPLGHGSREGARRRADARVVRIPA